MKLPSSTHQEEAEDVFFGQIVIILARWFLLAALMILALGATRDIGETSTVTLLMVLLMAINFYLHGRYVLEQPANRLLLIAVGVLDLLIVTFFVLGWSWGGKRGLTSEFFIFYYPLVLAYALVFPARVALRYALMAIGLYLGVCLFVNLTDVGLTGYVDISALKTIVTRLVTLGAMSGLGTFYWRIQRQRRLAV